MVNGLNQKQFDIAIACGSNQGKFFKEVEKLGVPIYIFETKTTYRPYLTLISRIWKISKFYKSHQFDIIHSWQWSNDWTEALAARLVRVKWLYTKKAMGFNNKHWHIKSYMANFIVTINEEMQAYFPKKKQQALIPLGIDTTYYNSKLFQNSKDNSKFNLITVANLVPVKGIQVLLKTLFELSDKRFNLIIIGDCNNEYGLEMKALSERLVIQDQVQFLGKKLDVRPYLASSDIYIIPTLDEGRKEGMPMALVEAMSMGVPVIGSDITGINYVLKNFKNLLFEAGNSHALMLKIKELMDMDEKSRLELGMKLRAYCELNFTMDAFVSAHEELYKKLHGIDKI